MKQNSYKNVNINIPCIIFKHIDVFLSKLKKKTYRTKLR